MAYLIHFSNKNIIKDQSNFLKLMVQFLMEENDEYAVTKNYIQ